MPIDSAIAIAFVAIAVCAVVVGACYAVCTALLEKSLNEINREDP